MRRTACVVALTSLLVACSGGEQRATDEPSVVATTEVASTTEPETVSDAGEARDVDPIATSPTGPEVWTLMFSYEIVGFGDGSRDGSTSLSFDPTDPGDIFDDASACSGLRDQVGAYSVFVSTGGPAAPFYAGVWTSDPVVGAGIYDAQIRVEDDGDAYDAVGTITFDDDDLRSAEFVGFGVDGGEVSGSFRCGGSDGATPLALGADDGVLDSVEVFALLRRAGATRIASLATNELLLAGCPGASSDTGDGPVLSVRGGPGIGSITAFELTDDRISMRVGSVEYLFSDVVLTDADGAGTVTAVGADGTILDAAYRCT